tara:strand:+ start:720 stop:1397 length:678 start_codon:yes stop_codon:yes gene_type:complete
MNIIALIPARGGSKGIPKKNIKLFNGEPLVNHSIKYAKNCNLIDKIYVSTDDEEISLISSKAGASVIKRPINISGDNATTESAIKHTLKSLSKKPDIIVLLQPTSPYRPKGSLQEALDKFIDNDYDSLLSISPTHRFIWSIDKKNNLKASYDFLKRPRRQDLKTSEINFIENGSLYIFKYESFLLSENRLGGKIGYVEFDEEFSHEIDTYYDFKFLEGLVKNETN